MVERLFNPVNLRGRAACEDAVVMKAQTCDLVASNADAEDNRNKHNFLVVDIDKHSSSPRHRLQGPTGTVEELQPRLPHVQKTHTTAMTTNALF